MKERKKEEEMEESRKEGRKEGRRREERKKGRQASSLDVGNPVRKQNSPAAVKYSKGE